MSDWLLLAGNSKICIFDERRLFYFNNKESLILIRVSSNAVWTCS